MEVVGRGSCASMLARTTEEPVLRIEIMDSATLSEAKALVDRVFPAQGPFERLFPWTFIGRESAFSRAVLRLAGVSELTEFWVAIDDDGTVIGTTGLYRHCKDAHEAVWLSWFCVAPESRGNGLGGRLLDFSIERARRSGADFLRLYTSDTQNEAAAQRLYEGRGLRVYQSRNRILYRLLRRELRLN